MRWKKAHLTLSALLFGAGGTLMAGDVHQVKAQLVEKAIRVGSDQMALEAQLTGRADQRGRAYLTGQAHLTGQAQQRGQAQQGPALVSIRSTTSAVTVSERTREKYRELEEARIVEGRSEGDPDWSSEMTRAEMATVLYRIFDLEPVLLPATLTDSAGHWAETNGCLEAVKRAGLMEGTGPAAFEPDRPVTKEQLAVILLNALRLEEDATAPKPEGRTSAWASGAVATAVSSNLLAPADNYTQPISRAEAVDSWHSLFRQVRGEPRMYELELSRWNIHNDGTHPLETTKGLNAALQWAHDQRYTTFHVPAGTYLIAKGERPFDPNARIEMVANMTLWLDDDAVIQKESNGFEGYETIRIGPEARNATLRGGTYRGDKSTHDYSGKDTSWSQGTHENGVGIHSNGSVNLTIDGVKATHFAGDALIIGAEGKQIAVLGEQDFEPGAVDEQGALIPASDKIRTKPARTTFADPAFEKNRTMMFSNAAGIGRDVRYTIFFYDANDALIASLPYREIDWSYVPVPAEAAYYRAVFETSAYRGVRLEYWNRALSRGTLVRNSEFSDSRRQGITVAGAEQITIAHNSIHDIKGTAPQSGIDLEGGIGRTEA